MMPPLPIDPSTLSGYEVRMLRVIPVQEHHACEKELLNRLASVVSPVRSFQRFPMRLLKHGLVLRKKSKKPGSPYVHWLSDVGAATLQAVEDIGLDPDDKNDELMAVGSTKRGPVTFQETMRSFGLTNLQQLKDLPLPERRAFEREWSANMYAACALAGEPIPNLPPRKFVR